MEYTGSAVCTGCGPLGPILDPDAGDMWICSDCGGSVLRYQDEDDAEEFDAEYN